MHNSFTFWAVFTVIIAVLFTVDLFITDRRKEAISIKKKPDMEWRMDIFGFAV